MNPILKQHENQPARAIVVMLIRRKRAAEISRRILYGFYL